MDPFSVFTLLWNDQANLLDDCFTLIRVDEVEESLYGIALLGNLALGCHYEWSLKYIVTL